ncbi:hypothetical protein VPLG_00037 [Vibrio phage eugene 12A10]|uniref:hypothetical protein n=1 Tax=Vibrio phage eugene 12A10 TaxID=573172 RepID=UPI000351A922|nr:hypothetical protein VPLG_00037 [Vibrio phage eugene 12A10]AGN51476.1 hypothetical protein VPLG_00037 [Vibrio phage eugene 12A10]
MSSFIGNVYSCLMTATIVYLGLQNMGGLSLVFTIPFTFLFVVPTAIRIVDGRTFKWVWWF